MLKSTYKFLNIPVPTISNPTGPWVCMCTPLLQNGGWQVHPLFWPCMFSRYGWCCSVLVCINASPCCMLVCASARQHLISSHVLPELWVLLLHPVLSALLPVWGGEDAMSGWDGDTMAAGWLLTASEAVVWPLCLAPYQSYVSPHSHKFASIFYAPQADSFLKSLLEIAWLLLNPTGVYCKQTLSSFVSSSHSGLG